MARVPKNLTTEQFLQAVRDAVRDEVQTALKAVAREREVPLGDRARLDAQTDVRVAAEAPAPPPGEPQRGD